ncbi:hypothetical protein SDC9_204118 [bioreactor metagenome]|uniref:Uncharacterized protein n=1 Tax=bioreactor metagenome TaxID=1076179 RepID=A0A645IZU0_9ZZZZ
MVCLVVTIIHFHIQHRRNSTAVLSRSGTFKHLDILDGIAVESREESQQVIGIIDSRLIQ